MWTIALWVLLGGLANDFEDNKPGGGVPGWVNTTNDVKAAITTSNPFRGARCLRLDWTPGKASGVYLRSVPVEHLRGKRVRLRAAIRVESGQAQMWMRVDREGRKRGFFDNMADRRVVSSKWLVHEIAGNVHDDAVNLTIGFVLTAPTTWVDNLELKAIGDATFAAAQPPRPIEGRGLDNLVAFARLAGYVRHFHPSDGAVAADWGTVVRDGVDAVEGAKDAQQLSDRLAAVFGTIAPTVQVFPTGGEPKALPAPTDNIVRWHHHGWGTGAKRSAYRSKRVPVSDEPPEPLRAELPGGVTCLVPLVATTKASPSPGKHAHDANDRATRIAAVVLGWNVFQHFYPYFDVVETDWPAALREALKSAATDKDERAFLDTLRRMVAALHDGHGNVFHRCDSDKFTVPLAWAWIEDRLVVTHSETPQVERGAIVTHIDGRLAKDVLADREALISSATPQFKRYKALAYLTAGPKGSPVKVKVDGGSEQTLTRTTRLGRTQDPRPDPIAMLKPGVWYVDIERVTTGQWRAALDDLTQAKGIVFDFRGYPGKLSWREYFPHVIDKPVTSAQWNIPTVARPDGKGWTWNKSSWPTTPPREPFKAKKAFVIDGRAISYAESCMGIVEHYKLGEIVGEATAGTNGNVNPFTLPGGYRVMWTGMKVIKHDGSRHHGVGILPTIPVDRTLQGVKAGRDELLEKAVEAVSK